MILEPHRGWNYGEELRNEYGEIFLIVSPGQINMNLANPSAIMSMTTRRNDFLKPVEIYGIIDIFGRSMLSAEGDEWKRHRRVVGLAFNERSNALVWKESVRQASGMLRFWSRLEGNSVEEMRLEDTGKDTSCLTLQVISGAGFGVQQVWEGEDEDGLGDKAIAGFNTSKLKKNHLMPFQMSLSILMSGIILMAIFPVW